MSQYGITQNNMSANILIGYDATVEVEAYHDRNRFFSLLLQQKNILWWISLRVTVRISENVRFVYQPLFS